MSENVLNLDDEVSVGQDDPTAWKLDLELVRVNLIKSRYEFIQTVPVAVVLISLVTVGFWFCGITFWWSLFWSSPFLMMGTAVIWHLFGDHWKERTKDKGYLALMSMVALFAIVNIGHDHYIKHQADVKKQAAAKIVVSQAEPAKVKWWRDEVTVPAFSSVPIEKVRAQDTVIVHCFQDFDFIVGGHAEKIYARTEQNGPLNVALSSFRIDGLKQLYFTNKNDHPIVVRYNYM